MKKVLAASLVFGALALVGCGSDDDGAATATPVAACNSFAAALCRKAWGGCVDKPADKIVWGLNEADCRTRWELNWNCSTKKCESGTYDPAKGQECLNQYQNETCEQASNPLIQPAACSALCT